MSHIIWVSRILHSYNLDAFTSILQYVRWIYLWEFSAYDLCAFCLSQSLPISLSNLMPFPFLSSSGDWYMLCQIEMNNFCFHFILFQHSHLVCTYPIKTTTNISKYILKSTEANAHAFNTVTNPNNNNNSQMKIHLLFTVDIWHSVYVQLHSQPVLKRNCWEIGAVCMILNRKRNRWNHATNQKNNVRYDTLQKHVQFNVRDLGLCRK